MLLIVFRSQPLIQVAQPFRPWQTTRDFETILFRTKMD